MNSRTEVVEEQNELHLVGAPPQGSSQQEQQQPQPKKKQRPRVRWSEDTVDNENMGKKKSKICCIFHPQRSFDEESDDCHSCSSSSSDSDTESDSDSAEKKPRRPPSPNAYEYQPKYKNRSQLPPDANKPETS